MAILNLCYFCTEVAQISGCVSVATTVAMDLPSHNDLLRQRQLANDNSPLERIAFYHRCCDQAIPAWPHAFLAPSVVCPKIYMLKFIILKIPIILSTNSSIETCMQTFDSIHELRNGKRYNTAKTTTFSENNSSKGCLTLNSHEINDNEGPEICLLTQNEVNEQIKGFIAPDTRQLDDLTHPNCIRIITQGRIPMRVITPIDIRPTA